MKRQMFFLLLISLDMILWPALKTEFDYQF